MVCYQLWENLKERPLGEISQQDLVELGDVDKALAQFYEQTLAKVLKDCGVSEIDLRNWFETELITESGTRGTVYRGMEQTGGIPNLAVDLLAGYFLLRSEVRTGGTWYELVHDRFVSPILQANQAWRVEQPLIQMAEAWIADDKSISNLLEGQQLSIAVQGNWQGLGKTVEEFIEASQQAQAAKDETKRQQELAQAQALAEEQSKRAELQAETTAQLRRRAWWLGLLMVFVILMAGAAAFLALRASQEAEQSNVAQSTAVSALGTAQAEATAAEVNASAARVIIEGQKATEVAMNVEQEAASVADATRLAEEAVMLQATITAQAVATLVPQASATPPPTSVVYSTPEDGSVAEDDPTPTPTHTATPNWAATEAAEAEARLATVQAEQEAAAVAAIAVQECELQPTGAFRETWEMYQTDLGCPFQAEPIGGSFAEQGFERGFMIWSQILDEFFVIFTEDDHATGGWEIYDKTEFTSDANCEPSIEKHSPDLVPPVRGFGSLWCSFPEIQVDIGYGVDHEAGVANNLIQEFEGGYIVRDAQGHINLLFNEDGSYERIE